MTCLGKRKDGQPCAQRCVRFCRWHTNSDLCSICLEQPADPLKLNCGHSFCEGCIYNWMYHQHTEATCPTCRTEISKGIKENAFIWGFENGILEKVDLYTYELSDRHYINVAMSKAHVFLGKLLTETQFDLVVRKLPFETFRGSTIKQTELIIFKGKIQPQDFYCIN
jgi:hypothetical protein